MVSRIDAIKKEEGEIKCFSRDNESDFLKKDFKSHHRLNKVLGKKK